MTSWLLDALAVSRLTQLVVEDKITEDLRMAVMNRWPGTKVAYLVNCPACTSVWAALLIVGMSRIPSTRWVVRALALSEGALLLRKVKDG